MDMITQMECVYYAVPTESLNRIRVITDHVLNYKLRYQIFHLAVSLACKLGQKYLYILLEKYYVSKFPSYVLARYYMKLRHNDLEQATAEQFLSHNS